jgi:hypothetical protein
MIIASKDIEWFMLENLHKIQNIFSNPLFMAGMRLVIMESYINPIAYELSENNNYNEVAEVTVRILKMYMDKGSVIRCDVDQVVHSYYNGLNSLNETYLLNDTWGKEQSGILMEMEAYTRMYIDLLMGRIGHE